MMGIGKLLLLLGIGSFVLHLAGMEFKLLMWIDAWGPDMGNAIRIGIGVLGGLILFIGARKTSAQSTIDSLDDIKK